MKASLRARAAARRVKMPSPWSIEGLVHAVAESRGRQIILLPREAAADSITGTVVSMADADVLLVRDDLEGMHREHVICHELGHLLAGHADSPAETFRGEGLAGAASILLNRQCAHGDAREREAEAMAELLLMRARRNSRPGYAAGLA